MNDAPMTGRVWDRFPLPRYEPEAGQFSSDKARLNFEKQIAEQRRSLEKTLRAQELRLSRIRHNQKHCPSSNISEMVRLTRQLTECYGEIHSTQQKLQDLGKELEGA